ncbi:hypothetical protein Bhyg_01306 [Pseudolycoriella hygida]|uniref:Uncharacterized protein n=1 Tax=Pseudolycoriella hygida TaxID=35572 RepID=A0A9Q0NAS4_9DIPT|nr:hypothetical protein Bhyg_01306 [Pseudolycoriella hygida]
MGDLVELVDEPATKDDIDYHYYLKLREKYPNVEYSNIDRLLYNLRTLIRLVGFERTRSAFICRECKRLVTWMPDSIVSPNEWYLKCDDCEYPRNFLQFNVNEAVEEMLKLAETVDIQLIASTLYLVLKGNRKLAFSLHPIPDNPFDIVKEYIAKYPKGYMFGGGDRIVVIAELYMMKHDPDFPILVLSDTKMLPPRYYLHALRFDWQDFSQGLLEELATIGNRVIKSGSILVLGPILQRIIDKEAYAKDRHNLKLVVPFDKLSSLDGNGSFCAAEDFKKIISEAEHLCEAVEMAFHRDVLYEKLNRTILRNRLQFYLAAANWMRLFEWKVYQYFLYHCEYHCGNIFE